MYAPSKGFAFACLHLYKRCYRRCEGELSDVSAWVLDIRVAEGELCLARFVVCSKITPYLFIIITQAGLKMEKSDQDNMISLFKPVFIDFKALYGSIILFYKIHRCD